MFFTLEKCTVEILLFQWVEFFTRAVLTVVFPLSLVKNLVAGTVKGSFAVHLALMEFTHVIKTITESQSTLALADIIFPTTSIVTAVREFLFSKSMANVKKL